MLEAANYLECKKAKKALSHYIYDKLSLKNYYFYYELTKLYHMKSLKMTLCNFLLQQYLLKEDTLTFYKLNYQDLLAIFSSSQLSLSSELELFNAAVDWINYKKNERSKHMHKLLRLIRLPLLSDEILINVIKNHKLCKDCRKCKVVVDNAIESKTSCNSKASKLQFRNRYYSCQFEAKKFVCIGGEDRDYNKDICVQTCSEYEFDETSLEQVGTTSEMLKQRNWCRAAVIGKKIYCFGGKYCAFSKNLKSCEVYCRKNNSWSPIAPLPGIDDYLFFDYRVCAFMNKVYAFGDLFFGSWVYDPARDEWEKISSMNKPRFNTCCVVFQGQCVVAGGRLAGGWSNWRTTLKSVESYDHYLDKWTFLPNMNDARDFPGLVTKENKLYVIGGASRNYKPFKNSEVYDSLSKTFTYLTHDLPHWVTQEAYTLIFENTIVVTICSSCYVYDIAKNEWRKYRLPTRSFSCVKVHKFLE